ncbi:MAG: GAF domain-containing protein [Anaerolineae bacterium]|nr:GAF domain-containing protein [Anaerolineae bacterium]
MSDFKRFLGLDRDDDRLHVRLILYVISCAALVMTGILAVTSAAMGFDTVTAATAVAFVISVVMLVLTWRNHVTWPRLGFPLFAFAIATYLVVVGDGIRDEGMYVYPLTLVLAGLLLGQRGVIAYTLLSLFAATGIVYGEVTGAIVTHFSERTNYFNLVVFVTLLSFMGLLLYITINSLNHNLRRARQNEQRLVESNYELEAARALLESRVAERTCSAEAARAEAETARQALEVQMWQVAGQAALSDAMRGEQDIPTLADAVIRQVCHYVDATIGTLFVREGNELYPVGRYAHAGAPEWFQVGQGAVGQAAAEGRAMLIRDVPPGRLTLVSGLGEIVPNHILVSPFSYRNKVTGVVELGSLTGFTPAQEAFVASVMESIAIAFNTTLTRARVDALLAETQQQAEELQAREEELRAANEELQTLNAELEEKTENRRAL